MAYTKQTWQDLPSKTTPINASRLGHIEQGIYDAASTADTAASDASSAISGLADKVDKVEGKGLSTNDFTDALKIKLDNIESGAEVNVQADYAQNDTTADDYIKNKPTLGTASAKNSTSVVTDSSDLVESGAVYDVVGWGNKNLLPNNAKSQSGSGVTYTVNSDGTDSVVGTASAVTQLSNVFEAEENYNNVKLTGIPQKNLNVYMTLTDLTTSTDVATDIGEGSSTFNLVKGHSYNCKLIAGASLSAQTPIIVSPMISTDGGTYEPYHVSVEQTLRDAEVVQGKNLLPNNLESQTKNTVVITVNKDKSVKLNGTATSNANVALCDLTNSDLPSGNYILSSLLNSNTKFIKAEAYNGSTFVSTLATTQSGDNQEFAVDWNGYNTITVSIRLLTTATYSNETFYPMIRLASVTDDTYEPYYIPLKDVVPNKCDNSVIGNVENGDNASQAYAVGEHFIRGGAFCTVKNAISANESLVGSSKFSSGDVADSLLRLLPIFNNAGSHNGIFRGKNLGSSLTAAQKTAIAAGTFDDMYIGDYWEINSVKYRIAHFDYWLNCGDGSNVCTDHHVVVVPDSALVNKRMNAKVDNADTTAGAYVNSEMRKTNLADAKTIVNAAFGADNILTHREYLQNAVTDGYESGGAWLDANIELMSEIMVYGSNIFHNIRNGTALPNNYTINKTQLALFRLDPSYIICKNVAQTDRSSWWLRDVVSATSFAFVAANGSASSDGASGSHGVRPAFGIK